MRIDGTFRIKRLKLWRADLHDRLRATARWYLGYADLLEDYGRGIDAIVRDGPNLDTNGPTVQ